MIERYCSEPVDMSVWEGLAFMGGVMLLMFGFFAAIFWLVNRYD